LDQGRGADQPQLAAAPVADDAFFAPTRWEGTTRRVRRPLEPGFQRDSDVDRRPGEVDGKRGLDQIETA